MISNGQSIINLLLIVWAWLVDHLAWIVVVLIALVSWLVAVHALLNKRDSRAALGWIAVCLMFPPVGVLLYFLFGINRVRTHGLLLGWPLLPASGRPENKLRIEEGIIDHLVPEAYIPITVLADRITDLPLLSGNSVKPLQNGETAFPSMLAAIENAQKYLYLSTYILETNTIGRRFIKALSDAAHRGVDVRVILDGVGEYYSLPRAGTLLKRNRVPVARFLPPKLMPLSVSINLRNHRKIMISDGRVGYTGGMNIGDRYLVDDRSTSGRVEDIHFRVFGPVVTQMEQVFLADWQFCTGVAFPHHGNREETVKAGDAFCRTIVDGPNEDLDKLSMILVGAVAAARHRVLITTPYFLPAKELIGALKAASLRGVDVRILLPSKNNLPYVKWASDNMLWELLQRGVRIYYQPPPFVHSKVFLVDDFYSIIGSANIDPRSLRLNFEMVLEVFDQSLNFDLANRFERAISKSSETTLSRMDGRSLPVRIRDSLCWLFSPYL